MTCVSQGTTNYDVDGDRDNDYCYEREWWDCNTDSQCPSNKWCTGSGGSPKYDCVADLGLCSACSRSNQCQSGTTCISGKCRIAATEAGFCSNNIDDDCDGVKDCQGSGEPECNCCGGENAECCANDVCNSGLYCSKINPTTYASVPAHCCDSSPLEWWNPAIIGDYKCTGVDECTPCSPFHPSCSPTSIYGCCSFLNIYTDRVITTY